MYPAILMFFFFSCRTTSGNRLSNDIDFLFNTQQSISLKKGIYRINKTINVSGRTISIKGISSKETILEGFLDNSIFKFKGKVFFKTSVRQNISKGKKLLFLDESNKKIEVGDLISISSNEYMPELNGNTYKKYFVSRVSGVRGNNVMIEDAISFNFSKQKNIAVEFFKPMIVTLSDLTITGQGMLYLIEVSNVTNLICKNVRFQTSAKKNQGLIKGKKIGTSAVAVYKSHNINVSSCHFDYIWYGLMAHKGCQKVRLSNSSAFMSRHINNNALGTVDFQVVNCQTKDCYAGFDSHRTALHTLISNCKDVNGLIPSKLRGRQNEVRSSLFEKGIEMTTDKSLCNDKRIQKKEIYNKLYNTKISGHQSTFWGANTEIKKCTFNDIVQTHDLEGYFVMSDTKIIISRKRESKSNDILTIGNSSCSGNSYHFSLNNVEISGFKLRQKNSSLEKNKLTGIYIPLKNEAIGALENISISNVNRGLILYGGSKAKNAYSKMKIKNIIFENCNYGVFQQKFEKAIEMKGVLFKNCQVENNEPRMIPCKN